jgi:hypothetical protein
LTDLSPAAQAVLDAYEAVDCDPFLGNPPETALAAAIRVAAEKIEDLYCESDVDSSDGVVFAMRQLVLIADELEEQ